MNYSYEQMRGAVMTLVHTAVADTMQCTEDELALLTQPEPWHASQRGSVVNTIEKVIGGGLEAQGYSRADVPAEYAAAAIDLAVHPMNTALATQWLPMKQFAPAIIQNEEVFCTPLKMLAMIIDFRGSQDGQRSACRERFGQIMKKREIEYAL